MSQTKLACCYMVHDDSWFLEESLASFAGPWPTFVFVSQFPWGGRPGDYKKTIEIAERCGATVVEGIWITEDEQRRFVLSWLRQNGFTHALLPDSDELIEVRLLNQLVRIAEGELADRVYVTWDTYWRSPEYVIRPRERFTPLILVDVRAVQHTHLRGYEGGRDLLLNDSFGIMHHLSYCGPDERIVRKVSAWGHKDEVVPDWLQKVWFAWNTDPLIRNLNPVLPQAYGCAERIHVPEILKGSYDKCQSYTRQSRQPIVLNGPLPKISVVIALCGGKWDIERCLDSLEAIKDLIYEVTIVDNGSDEETLSVVRGRDVRLIELGSNRGFAYANNRGIEASSGDLILLLNSDIIATRAGLVTLVNSLKASATIAAAGPLMNRAGHGQQIEPTYQATQNLELFAEDFAGRAEADIDRDMLVGAVMLIRRSVLDEIGLLDEKFGLGTYEDNDICYRMRRASYRLALSTKSYFHHEGSKTMERLGLDMGALMRGNEAYFRKKWENDIALGFSDTLSGLRAEPIHFDPARKPEALIEKYRILGKRARISLCIICRDEERVIRSCIESALPFFHEIIVNDTGSVDGTLEILKKYPLRLIQNPWEYSFSVARNQSIDAATGDWIFILDSDDELPLLTAMKIIDYVLAAIPDTGGFVLSVRFVDALQAAGVEVTHLKLFRNVPEYRYEHRIHEQILPAVHRSKRKVVWTDAYVIHSGYDNSPEGQKKKRERDEYMLMLDLQDTPDDPFKLFNLGMSYHYWGEHETAIDWFKKALSNSKPHHSQVGPVYSLWASSLYKLEKKAEALGKAKEGVVAVPGYPELHYKLAQWCLEIGNFNEAKNNLKKCVGADVMGMYTSMDRGILSFRSMHLLGRAELGLKHYDLAREWFLKALGAEPGYPFPVLDLYDAAVSAKDFPTANAMLERVRASEGFSMTWARMMSQQQDAIMGPGGGLEFLRSFLERNPEAHGTRLVFAMQLIDAGRPNDAVPHLCHLDELGIGPAAFHMGKLCMALGDFGGALSWMQRADQLEPGNAETLEMIEKLRKAAAAA